MNKLTLLDFGGNIERYNFYIESYKIFEQMEIQREHEFKLNEKQINENDSALRQKT